jgi:2,5-furandicarboxylate decarboxylase 1
MKDLQSFVAEYEKAYPQEVVHIEREISSLHEITALAIQGDEHWKDPPVLIFHHVKNGDGTVSPHPAIVNLFASRLRCARVIGTDVPHFARELQRRSTEQKRKPIVVKREDAPVKEVVARGKDVDVLKFPVLVHHYMDAGPYVSSGFATTYDPDSGIDNCGIQRGFVKAKDEIRFWPCLGTHNNFNLQKHWDGGQDMRFAYWVGHHPAVILGAEVRLGYPESHYEAAGGVIGESLRLVSSETLGEDFLVPADAEVVIEGIAKVGERKAEGPFGEAWGHTGAQRLNPVIRVTAVTHRRNACWISNMVSHKDMQVFNSWREVIILEAAKRAVPTTQNVYIPVPGIVFLQVKQTRRNQGREAGLAALAAVEGSKHVFVVDDDIDIYNMHDILTAIASRSQWDKDVIIIPRGRGIGTDPSITEEAVTAKAVIDCTKPAPPQPFEPRNSVPEEVMKRVRLQDYVPKKYL